MSTKHEQRSEETKKSIVDAAGKLFAEHGYDAVTMREIAKEAVCSHTTIYIYFKDKEALLHLLSMPSLVKLKQTQESMLLKSSTPEEGLKEVSLAFIRFCLANRTMYAIFFNAKSSRVDELEPELEINQVRNGLFGLLMRALAECFEPKLTDEPLLKYSRIYFFTLQGIAATYTYSAETSEALMERLTVTFNEAFEVLLLGINHKKGQISL